jgi:hypothetical protein
MKIKIIKDVFSSAGWRREGDIVSLDGKTANHYIKKGIGIEYKEEKQKKETKEAKTPRKRTTKKAK